MTTDIALKCAGTAARHGVIAALMLATGVATAGVREQAQRMHDRLTGVPPTEATLNEMVGHLPHDPVEAARIATHDPRFYTVTLKNFAAPWTNRDQSPFVPLNDYMTLVIGLVANDESFDQILHGDVLYYGPNVQPPVSASSNAHFEALETEMMSAGFDPENPAHLARITQSSVYPVPPEATAGATTTRAAAEAFFIAGTNRAMFRFTLINHMCLDLEQVQDTSGIPDRIRQDVSRSPGGDSRVFNNNCIGCHIGMDPLTQAYAYYDFDPALGRIVYTDGVVQPKYFNNAETFADGYVTPDDSWDNYWRVGQNSLLGWDPSLPGSGNGAKSMGLELARSEAFAQCQVKKVFRNVCLRDPADAGDRAQVESMTAGFRLDYNLRDVFAESAAYCRGD